MWFVLDSKVILDVYLDDEQPGGRKGVEVALDLGDAVLQGQQALPQESLKDRSHTRPAGRRSSLFGGKDMKE